MDFLRVQVVVHIKASKIYCLGHDDLSLSHFSFYKKKVSAPLKEQKTQEKKKGRGVPGRNHTLNKGAKLSHLFPRTLRPPGRSRSAAGHTVLNAAVPFRVAHDDSEVACETMNGINIARVSTNRR